MLEEGVKFNPPFEETKKYRLHVQYQSWIGKADPSGFGKYFIYSDDPDWIFREALLRTREGDKVLATQKRVGKRWIKM